jgi:CRP/FNR family transcriptional regulator, cyclic AMP receptor protein
MVLHSITRRPHECMTCELRPSRCFCNLHQGALRKFASIGEQLLLDQGAMLFREGAASSAVFVICTGQVKLSSTSKAGKTLILKIANPGEMLGLGPVVSGSKYLLSAETIQPTELKRIRREEFLDLLENHAEASLHAAKALSAEYTTAFFDARRLALSGSAAARTASVLLDWGRASSAGNSEMRFTMPLTHEELFNMVGGGSRETVTPVLGRFKRDKLIRIDGSSIVILAPERLEKLAV